MIALSNVVPIPLQDQIQESQIWKTDFVFETQKRYFVEAPSGKGKTSLQHFLYGLRHDYTGTISIDQQDIKGLDLNQWAAIRQKKLSVIFQDLRLFLDLTAWDNILLKNKLTEHKTAAEIEQMAERLGVADLLQKKCGKMSYGQRQRIAIIRALCQPFSFLLMDEPFSHLDSLNVQKCCELIEEETTANLAGYAIASLEERYQLSYDIEVAI